ncbi:MAG TPA: hypothetical protein VGK25_04215, partial [Ignavibacteria bacterium]
SEEIFYFFFFIIPCIYLFFAVKRVYHSSWSGALIPGLILSLSYWILSLAWVIGTVFEAALRV